MFNESILITAGKVISDVAFGKTGEGKPYLHFAFSTTNFGNRKIKTGTLRFSVMVFDPIVYEKIRRNEIKRDDELFIVGKFYLTESDNCKYINMNIAPTYIQIVNCEYWRRKYNNPYETTSDYITTQKQQDEVQKPTNDTETNFDAFDWGR